MPIELTEEEKSHVFVFDEEYIDKNVKFHESGLDTIIMLGHQVEIAEQLQEAQKNLEKAKGEFDIQEKTIIENEKIECKNSPKYHIKKMRLIPFPHNGRQEYTELMKIVYRFALGDADEYELVIGNIMRQVLEAFSTFQYKKGIEEVSTDRSILAILPEKEYQSYFENLMYRLILNNGSHRLDQTRSMSDMNFFTVISDSEKKRTAKEILCFIYLLNEKHVLAHLDGCSNVQSNLSKWCNDVKNKVGA